MKKILLIVILFACSFAGNTQGQPSVSPQAVCDAALGYLNQLSNGQQYQKIMGALISKKTDYGIDFREYSATENFPLSQKTIILDTNKLQKFRSVKALMLTQTLPADQVGQEMKGYYDQITGLFKLCLEAQKFTYENPGTDYAHQHKMIATYRFQMPSKSPFGNMQSGNVLQTDVFIDQHKNTDGTFTNDLYITFRRV